MVAATAAAIDPFEVRHKVVKDVRFNLVGHDPDVLFNIIDQQQRDQGVIDANDAARRQTATRRDARSVAAAEIKLQGTAAESTTESRLPTPLGKMQSETVGTRATSVLLVASKVTSNGTAHKATRARRGKGVHGQSHGQAPKPQQ